MQFAEQFTKQNLPEYEDKVMINFGTNVSRFLKFFCRDMYEVCVWTTRINQIF